MLGRELDEALDEVRTIAHDMYPPLLRDAGIGPALAQAVRKSPNAHLRRVGSTRYPQEIEAAVYFAALEALQNASKHAGPDAEIVVAVWESSDEVRFEVRDNGVGLRRRRRARRQRAREHDGAHRVRRRDARHRLVVGGGRHRSRPRPRHCLNVTS